jgi:hypothetical protein
MKYISIVFFFIISNTFAQTLSDNLLLHYSFNGNANDDSANSHDGINSGATFGLDRFGNPNSAAYFDGIDDYIDLPNLLALKPDLPVTFSFWIKYSSSDPSNRAVFNTSFEEDRSSGVSFNTQISTGTYGVSFGDGTYNYTSATRRSFNSTETIENDNWHHVVAIVNSATNMQIFIDCKDFGGNYHGTGGNLEYSNTSGSIGRRDRDLSIPAEYFQGAIDDFMYWDRELTLYEINSLCNQLDTSEFSLNENHIILYPNPTSEILNIKTTIELDYISIYNLFGQLVFFDSFKNKINIGNLLAGIYLIEFSFENKVERKKIIVK